MSYTSSNLSVASDAFPITPSDVGTLARAVRAIYIGGTGAVTVKTRSGAVVTFAAVPQGRDLQIEAVQIMATGTTATLLVGLV
jgi:hypothetical protein